MKEYKNLNLYKKNHCSSCNEPYDYAKITCPKCHNDCNDEDIKREWHNLTPLGPAKEIACFLTGWLGLKIIGLIVSLIVKTNATNWVYANFATAEDRKLALQSIFSSGAFGGIINYTCYIVLFIAFLLILFKDNKRVLKKFAEGKTYIGFAIGIGLMIVNAIYATIISKSGLTASNANQDSVNNAATFAPLLALLVFGLIGPFCEEVTYRLGLFNFTKRWNKIAAYIITPLIFGLIHFNWGGAFNFSTEQAAAAAIIEWVNLPSYIIAGLILTFTYDKLGFGASFIAHATNNFIGILFTIIFNH